MINEQEIRELIEREINGIFLKVKLPRFPKFEISLEKPDKDGWIKTPDGKTCIANVGSYKQNVNHLKHYYPNGEILYEEIWEEPIEFSFPLGKNEYCYTHLARHETIHYIRSLVINNIPEADSHDKMFYKIGNILFSDFEYRHKNLCKECPENRAIE